MSILDSEYDIIAEKDAEIAKLKQEVETLKLLNDAHQIDNTELSAISIYKKLAFICTIFTGNDAVGYGYDVNEITESYYYIDKLYRRAYFISSEPKRIELVRNLLYFRGWKDFLRILFTKMKK